MAYRYKSPFEFSFQMQPYYFHLFPLGVGILLTISPYTVFMGNIFDNYFFKLTAKLSFGLYIWHYVVFELIRILIVPEFNDKIGIATFYRWINISFTTLIISFIFAFISWKFIEKPVLDWSLCPKCSDK